MTSSSLTIPVGASLTSCAILLVGHLAQLYVCNLLPVHSPDTTGNEGLHYSSIMIIVSVFAIGLRLLIDLKDLGLVDRMDNNIRLIVLKLCSRYCFDERLRAIDTRIRELSMSSQVGAIGLIYKYLYIIAILFLTFSVILSSARFRSFFSDSNSVLSGSLYMKNKGTATMDYSSRICLLVGWLDSIWCISIVDTTPARGSGNNNNNNNSSISGSGNINKHRLADIDPAGGKNCFKSIIIESIKKSLYIITMTQVLIMSLSLDNKNLFSIIDAILVCLFTLVYTILFRIAAFYYQNRASIITVKSLTKFSEILSAPAPTSSSCLDRMFDSYIAYESPIAPHRSSLFIVHVFKATFLTLLIESLLTITARRLYGHMSLILSGGLLGLYLVIKIFYSA